MLHPSFCSQLTKKTLTRAPRWPSKIGYDLAGEVVAVGSSVSTFKTGDEVYSRVSTENRGTLAEYCLSTVSTTALKPTSLTFAEAAATPLAAQTALQALDIGEERVEGGLRGKIVYVPAGLSGTGSFAVQLAKNVFGAKTVVTSLSPSKIRMVEELMGERGPDVIVNYQKEKTVDVTGKGRVDFMFDTVGETIKGLDVVKKGGCIVSISTAPHGTSFKKKNPGLPTYLEYILNVVDWVFRTYTGWWGVNYQYLVMQGNAKDLERLRGWVGEGKVKPVVGNVVKLSDIEGVRKGCQQILDGKGGVGKFVVEID
jgi:NADPH:quinone reductase-like Zn-dependent oxidoreductase